MIYLLLNIILSSFFILCVKWVQARQDDIVGVGMVNYVVAAVVGSLLLLGTEPTPFSWSSILTGTLNGVCYFTAFFVLIRAVIWKGAANISVVARLSILVPLVAGIAIFGERPGAVQSLGVLLACAGLALIGRRQSNLTGGQAPRFALLILAAFFLIAGGSRLAQEVFKHICHPDERAAFLVTAFGLTAAGAVIVQASRRRAPGLAEWVIGTLLGLANLGQTFCILKALEYYEGYIVFPLTSAGGLLFTTLVAVLLLKERLSLQSYAGIGLAACSLALLYPQPAESPSRREHGERMNPTKTSRLPRLYTHPIGSLPRPRVVRDLVARRDALPPAQFKPRMDDMVRFAIRLQEQAGLDVISDGEWRRTQYIKEFLARVGGFQRSRRFQHQGEVKLTEVVVKPMVADQPVFAGDARFLCENTEHCTKFALPSPFLIAVRYWHEDYSRDAYPTFEHFLDHLTGILTREAAALVDVGIDIVQLDDPALTYFCDRRLMAGELSHDERLRRDWDIDRQLPQAVEAINRIADGLGAQVHLHCCHSVYRRRSDVMGDYEPILSRLGDLRVDQINLEFAYPETGDVSDLNQLPDHLRVGMGVVDVRNERLQSVDEIESLADAGIAILRAERVALNPDCGFAPDAGEPPTIDEAYEKLCRLVTAAKRCRERLAPGT